MRNPLTDILSPQVRGVVYALAFVAALVPALAGSNLPADRD